MKNCKDCKRRDLLIEVLKFNFVQATDFLDYIADNYPKTDKEITNFLNMMAEKQIEFNMALETKKTLDKKFRRKFYDNT
jgi:hypothetical protein